uniref:SAM domain-containing protein n=1 Tax=Tetraselmis sp. GSL018 TaxID=582737 RepID=A0A061RGR6_9CHLO
MPTSVRTVPLRNPLEIELQALRSSKPSQDFFNQAASNIRAEMSNESTKFGEEACSRATSSLSACLAELPSASKETPCRKGAAEQFVRDLKAFLYGWQRWFQSCSLQDLANAATAFAGALVAAAFYLALQGLWVDPCPEQRLRRFLHKYRLRQYTKQLCAQGYELLEDLALATEEELEAAGVLLAPHRRRIAAHAGRALVQWSWAGTAALAAAAAAALALAAAAGLLAYSPGARARLKAAAGVALLVLWQQARLLVRIWQSVDVATG